MTRKWFQIHLSTAVVLMFVAGGLMWLADALGFFAGDIWVRAQFVLLLVIPTLGAVAIFFESFIRRRERGRLPDETKS